MLDSLFDDGIDSVELMVGKLKSFAAAANSELLWNDGDFGMPRPDELLDRSIAPTTIASECSYIRKDPGCFLLQ